MGKLRVVAVHDAEGTIEGFILRSEDAPSGAVTPESGQSMVEVKIADAVVDPEDQETHRRLSEILERYRTNYKVQVKTAAKLVRKDSE